MTENDSSKYNDLVPKAFGGMKKIKRLPSMEKHAPSIRWGDEYDKWPMRKRLRYAQRLASSMNHAADVLQQERNKLLETCAAQHRALEQAKVVHDRQGQTMNEELATNDAEKQGLYEQIVALQRELKAANKKIEDLEAAIP